MTNGPNWDKDLQEDRTCQHGFGTADRCREFGTYKVTTLIDGDRLTDGGCARHSVELVVDARMSSRFGEVVTRMPVAR